MKLIIAGCRDHDVPLKEMDRILRMSPHWTNVNLSVYHGYDMIEIVTGGCRGVDHSAKAWAMHHRIPHREFPADWNTHGKAAGPIRNKQMAEYADKLVALWDGESRGTLNMIQTMTREGKPVFVWPIQKGRGE